jgi:two-component system chemotaxis response regulator CheB
MSGIDGVDDDAVSASPPARHAPPFYDLVVLAASAGGLHALSVLLSSLPRDLPVPVALVLHRTPHHPDLLAKILGRHTALRVKNALPGEHMEPGTVYVAPADLHLVIESDGALGFSDGRRIRHVLSSANPLLESAALFGGRVIAVVLTGSGHDATDGVQAVRARGGVVIAQDEATSTVFGMPRSAIATGAVAHVLPLAAIGPSVARLVTTGAVE